MRVKLDLSEDPKEVERANHIGQKRKADASST
jgi:hypothetical protein